MLHKRYSRVRMLSIFSLHLFYSEGNIADVDADDVIANKYIGCQFDEVIDASGCCVIPGLIDAHTHPVWAGDRVHEFSLKLAGASYMEVHKVRFCVSLFRIVTSSHPDEMFLPTPKVLLKHVG